MATNEKHLCMGCMSEIKDAGICPHCGYSSDMPYSSAYLPPHTRLSTHYLVGRLLWKNGEHVCYIGYDTEEERKVFICEYMPGTLGLRNESNSSVVPRHGKEAQFKALRCDYIENAQQMKRFTQKHSNVVPVLDVLEGNGTAYVIYRRLHAVPLSDYLLKNGGELSWTQAKPMVMPLLRTLSALQKQNMMHRGISPENILVDEKNNLCLFGFATPSLRTGASELACQLYDGYTAPEQYAANGEQGPWSDVYAIAAVMYRILTGTLPLSAEIRCERDTLYPPKLLNKQIPDHVSDAIDRAMVVQPQRRTQAIDQLLADLLQEVDSNTAVFDLAKGTAGLGKQEAAPQHPIRSSPMRVMVGTTVALACLMLVLYFAVVRPMFLHQPPQQESSASEALSSESSSSLPAEEALPSFSGKFLHRVQQNTDYLGKYEFVVEQEYNEDVPSGVIYDQAPAAGEPVPKGSTVILKVSKGTRYITVPNLQGSTVEFATRTLDNMKIPYQIVLDDVPDAELNLVIRTLPLAGTRIVKERDVVYLHVPDPNPPLEEIPIY